MCLVDGHWQLRAQSPGKRHIDHPICEKGDRLAKSVAQREGSIALRNHSPDVEVFGTAGNATTTEKTQCLHVGPEQM